MGQAWMLERERERAMDPHCFLFVRALERMRKEERKVYPRENLEKGEGENYGEEFVFASGAGLEIPSRHGWLAGGVQWFILCCQSRSIAEAIFLTCENVAGQS